ncbi:MAG: hypothetical protein ACR2NN_10100 [Bryobacteraceae bacterium]
MPDSFHSRAWQIEALIKTAAIATPLQSELGQCFIGIPLPTEARQIVPLHSTAFQNWLLEHFYSEHRVLPRASVVREVIQLLEAKTQFGDTPRVPISRRIASAPGKVILDLYNDRGEVVEISSQGWRITQNLTAHFSSSRSASPLPHPETSRDAIQNFRALLHLTPEHFTHCMSWLTAAMSPKGPYPILVIQGSGKSSLATLLRSLIDPGPAPFCPVPQSSRDLQSLASYNWILALDDIEQLPSRMLRQLIRLSTGETFAVRDHPSDPEPFHLYLQRPMIFTTSAALAPELASLAIAIEAPALAIDSKPLCPRILGALCSAVSAGLANPVTRSLPAMPNAIATAVAAFLQDQTQWTGSATDLLLNLRAANPSIQWPATPKGLSQLLHKTPLGGIGFQSLKDSGSRRSIQLTKKQQPPQKMRRCAASLSPIRVHRCPSAAQKLRAPIPIRVHPCPSAANSLLSLRVHSRSFAARDGPCFSPGVERTLLKPAQMSRSSPDAGSCTASPIPVAAEFSSSSEPTNTMVWRDWEQLAFNDSADAR